MAWKCSPTTPSRVTLTLSLGPPFQRLRGLGPDSATIFHAVHAVAQGGEEYARRPLGALR